MRLFEIKFCFEGYREKNIIVLNIETIENDIKVFENNNKTILTEKESILKKYLE